MSEFSGQPGDLSEPETLARLTIEEKRSIAYDAIAEFNHLDDNMLHDWLMSYGGADEVSVADSTGDKVSVLVENLAELVETGEEPEALDHFIYGQIYPANLEYHGIDPDEVVERLPLDTWNGVYDLPDGDGPDDGEAGDADAEPEEKEEPDEVLVVIRDGEPTAKYHRSRDCASKSPTSEVIAVSRDQAMDEYGCEPCGICSREDLP